MVDLLSRLSPAYSILCNYDVPFPSPASDREYIPDDAWLMIDRKHKAQAEAVPVPLEVHHSRGSGTHYHLTKSQADFDSGVVEISLLIL